MLKFRYGKEGKAMKNFRKRGVLLLAAAAICAALSGCQSADSTRIVRIGHHIVEPDAGADKHLLHTGHLSQFP